MLKENDVRPDDLVLNLPERTQLINYIKILIANCLWMISLKRRGCNGALIKEMEQIVYSGTTKYKIGLTTLMMTSRRNSDYFMESITDKIECFKRI
jgi:hypothetical protein